MAHDGFFRVTHADALTAEAAIDVSFTRALNNARANGRTEFLGLSYSPLSEEAAQREIAARAQAAGPFVYAAVARARDVVALDREPAVYAPLFADACLTLNASAATAALARVSGVRLPRVNPAAVLEGLLRNGMDRDERICVIGGDAADIAALAARFKLNNVHWRGLNTLAANKKRSAIENVAQFITNTRARVTIIDADPKTALAVARETARRGDAIGIGVCAQDVLAALSGAAEEAPLTLRRGVRALQRAGRLAPAWFYWLCARLADWTASISARRARCVASSSL